MSKFLKGLAGVAVVVGVVLGLIGLVLVNVGRLSYFPWIFISGGLGMFASFALLVILFAHAVIATSKNDPV